MHQHRSEAQIALEKYQNNTGGKGQFQSVLERLLRLRQVSVLPALDESALPNIPSDATTGRSAAKESPIFLRPSRANLSLFSTRKTPRSSKRRFVFLSKPRKTVPFASIL